MLVEQLVFSVADENEILIKIIMQEDELADGDDDETQIEVVVELLVNIEMLE